VSVIDAAWFTPAAVCAGSVFVAGLLAIALWRFEDSRAARRSAARVETARRVAAEWDRFDAAWADIVAVLTKPDEPDQKIQVPHEGETQ